MADAVNPTKFNSVKATQPVGHTPMPGPSLSNFGQGPYNGVKNVVPNPAKYIGVNSGAYPLKLARLPKPQSN